MEQLLRIKEIIIKNRHSITGILIPKANSELIENCIEAFRFYESSRYVCYSDNRDKRIYI